MSFSVLFLLLTNPRNFYPRKIIIWNYQIVSVAIILIILKLLLRRIRAVNLKSRDILVEEAGRIVKGLLIFQILRIMEDLFLKVLCNGNICKLNILFVVEMFFFVSSIFTSESVLFLRNAIITIEK